MVRPLAEDNTALIPHGVVTFYHEVVESVVRAPPFGSCSEEMPQLSSSAERMRLDMVQEISAEEQRQQERQNSDAEAVAETAAAIPIKNLEAMLSTISPG
jgi:hypothetical protein